MIRKIAAIFLILIIASSAQAQSKVLYYVNPFSNNAVVSEYGYGVMDPDTGTENSMAFPAGVFPQVAGRVVTGANAITAHPVTGEMWAVLKLTGQTGRELVKINPDTFAITDIGNTGRNFSTLAFNADGSVLYAVTGNGDTNPEVMYTLNQSTGAPTLQCALGNGADGEIIAFNSDDGKLYHWSGNGTVVYERIDNVTGPSCAVTNIGMINANMSTYSGEVFGAVYDPTIQKFYVSNISSQLLTTNVNGTNTTVVATTTLGYQNAMSTGAQDVRGLGLRFLQEINVKGNGTSITSGDVTPDTADNTDFGSISYVSTVAKTFTIENLSGGTLSLTGNPLVALTGDPEFSVTALPSSSIVGVASTTFQITFSPTAVGDKTAVVSIANTDTDENPYTFTISASALSDNDQDGISDIDDPDDDNDGVSDEQEALDGTDPFDPDSYIEALGNTVCTEWNGFLNFLFQVLEQRNTGSSTISLTTTLYNSVGVAQDSVSYSLPAGKQQDFIVNDLNGFAPLSYGTICTTITSGPTDSLDGNYIYYLLGVQNSSSAAFTNPFFKYAFTEPFTLGRKGSQYLTYNTFNPTLNPADSGDFVGSYVQISNDDSSAQTGQLIFYGYGGEVVRTVPVALAAKQRIDVDVHSMGANLTGLVEWRPVSSSALFRVRINRYFYDGDFATGTLKSATSISAKKGSGTLLASTFSSDLRYSVLEISNTSTSSVNVTVNIANASGVDLLTSTIVIPARATRHVILNETLTEGVGNVTVKANASGALIASVLEYGLLDQLGTLNYANSFDVRESVGAILKGGYNNFLGTCTLRVVNTSGSSELLSVSMKRYDLTTPLSGLLSVPAGGSRSVDLCSNDEPMSYGVVTVLPTNPGSVVADVVRKSSFGEVEFTTPVRAKRAEVL